MQYLPAIRHVTSLDHLTLILSCFLSCCHIQWNLWSIVQHLWCINSLFAQLWLVYMFFYISSWLRNLNSDSTFKIWSITNTWWIQKTHIHTQQPNPWYILIKALVVIMGFMLILISENLIAHFMLFDCLICNWNIKCFAIKIWRGKITATISPKNYCMKCSILLSLSELIYC